MIRKIVIFGMVLMFILRMDAYAQEKQSKNMPQKVKGLTDDAVAVVNGEKILAKEYRNAYRKAEEYYRGIYRDGFNDELVRKLDIKNKVIKDIIKKRLWIQEAQKRGLEITDDELKESIMKMELFRKDGQFDRTLYERILLSNRMDVKDFEEAQRKELLTDKMRQVVRDSVVLTEEEVDEAFNAESTSKKLGTEKSEVERQSLKKFLQFQKQEKAVTAYADEMYKKAKITINKHSP